MTAIRLFFPLYVFGCPNNFIEFQTNIHIVVGIVVLAGSQVFILKAQSKYGSRFFIPERFLPGYYNYHQTFNVEREDYETCAICIADIISSTENTKTVNVNAQRETTESLAQNVLTTPCNHRFCQECLVRWMETKMICPTCRRQIPPYNS